MQQSNSWAYKQEKTIKRYMHLNIHNSTVHNSQDGEMA